MKTKSVFKMSSAVSDSLFTLGLLEVISSIRFTTDDVMYQKVSAPEAGALNHTLQDRAGRGVGSERQPVPLLVGPQAFSYDMNAVRAGAFQGREADAVAP